MKRFYKTASVNRAQGGFGVMLDGKAVKTPAKNPLQVPTEKLAQKMAREWLAQNEKIEPLTMPLNRLANTAIDRTKPRFDEVYREALNFARHDLLCYRAEAPADLNQAEAKAWDPFLGWVKKTYKADLKTTSGIGHIEQDPEALRTFKDLLAAEDPFFLTGVHNATTLTGSLVLALALKSGFKPASAIWRAAHIDEDYQIKKWGQDSEAARVRAQKRVLFMAIGQYLGLLD